MPPRDPHRVHGSEDDHGEGQGEVPGPEVRKRVPEGLLRADRRLVPRVHGGLRDDRVREEPPLRREQEPGTHEQEGGGRDDQEVPAAHSRAAAGEEVPEQEADEEPRLVPEGDR